KRLVTLAVATQREAGTADQGAHPERAGELVAEVGGAPPAELEREGQGAHHIRTVRAQQLGALVHLAEPGRTAARIHHAARVRVEGAPPPTPAPPRRVGRHGAGQPLMAEVHPVETADSDRNIRAHQAWLGRPRSSPPAAATDGEASALIPRAPWRAGTA